MEIFILFVLASVGLTLLVVDSSILEPFRNLMKWILPASAYKVFECYQCAGFWCGIVCGFLFTVNPFMLIMCGCAASFLASSAVLVMNYLEAKSIVDMGNDES